MHPAHHMDWRSLSVVSTSSWRRWFFSRSASSSSATDAAAPLFKLYRSNPLTFPRPPRVLIAHDESTLPPGRSPLLHRFYGPMPSTLKGTADLRPCPARKERISLSDRRKKCSYVSLLFGVSALNQDSLLARLFRDPMSWSLRE